MQNLNFEKALNRRKFLAATAIGAATLYLPSCKKDDTDDGAKKQEAIVIGTGFGGAIAALRLAQSGVQVTMIERGRRWDITPTFDTFSPSLPADKRSTWLDTRTNLPLEFANMNIEKYIGVLERMIFENISVYAGAGVGGGSLVYGGMTVEPNADLFAQAFPPEISLSELKSKYFPTVKQMIGATKAPADLLTTEYYQYANFCKQQTENVSGANPVYIEQAYNWDIIRKEMNGELPASAINGDLIYGNNTGAKNSLDQNYIKQAESTGKVTIKTQHQVANIKYDPATEKYTVECDIINEQGDVVSSTSLSTYNLFVAAGSVNTTRLLVKAKNKGYLPNLNSEVGNGWGTNGNGMFMRSQLNGNSGAKQAAPPVLAIQDYENSIAPLLVESAQFPVGFECNCLLHLGLTYNTQRGKFVYNSQTDDVVIDFPSTGNDTSVSAIENFVNRVNAQSGGVLGSGFLQGVTKNFTYHPLGGMLLGKACDLWGRVQGYNRLYVIDGSLIPGTTCCANPSLTIAGIAERNIEHILTNDF